MVSRKHHSTCDTGQAPEAKVERKISKSEKRKKPKKTDDGTFKKDSKRIKMAGK
jgi:hypothetical protein